MFGTQLKKYLEQHHVPYRVIHHTPAYTAQETAELSHVSGKELAKTVMVKIDGKLAMVVEPANIRLDVHWLAHWLKNKKIELATERDFREYFPECEIGAMPPIGNLYNMDVFIDDKLTHDRYIAFNACTHSDLLEIAYKDFERLVKPKKLPMH